MDPLLEVIKNHPEQVNAFVALCALVISFVSILLTLATLRIQRIHNFKSVTPIADFPIGDYENQLTVKLKNSGVGPLIVEQFIASAGKEQKDDIISWMPNPPAGIYWDTFYQNFDGATVTPNESLSILSLTGDQSDVKFANFRDQVRRALGKLEVQVVYKDIYGHRMPKKARDLKWFARHFEA